MVANKPPMTSLTRIIAILAILLVAVPAGADPELNEPCTQTSLPLVTVADGQSVSVDTPIPFVADSVGGQFRVDLRGLEVGTTKNVNVTLSWDNVAGIPDASDYDMVVNGTTYNDVGTSESATLKLGHCKVVDVSRVYAFTGVPVDELTLDISISTFNF